MFSIFDGTFIKGMVDSFSADLAASQALANTSAAAAGQFEVDLQALYNHHRDVLKVYDDLFDKMTTLAHKTSANAIFETSVIDGVSKSFEATYDAATGGSGSDSMMGGLQVILGKVTQYANAIADVYKSYVQADTTGSTNLSAAGNAKAAGVTLPAGN